MTKRLNIKHAITCYLRESQDHLRAKWRDRIFAHLFEAPRDKRIIRMGEICDDLEMKAVRFSLKTSTFSNEEEILQALMETETSIYLQRAKCLFEDMAESFIQHDDVLTPMNIYREVVDSGILLEECAEKIFPPKLDGFARFITLFFSWIAATLDRSIRFALLFLDLWSEQDASKPILIGQRAPMTHQEIRILAFLAEVIKLECPVVNDEVVYGHKGWFLRIIEGIPTSPVAREILESCLNVATYMTHFPPFEILSMTPDEMPELPEGVRDRLIPEAARTPSDKTRINEWITLLYRPSVRLPPSHQDLFNPWLEEMREKQDEIYAYGDILIEWVQTHQTELERTFHERSQQIMEHPRRGLRPGGYDHIDVEIAPLRNAGLRSIVLHPEGHLFPDVGVTFIVRKETPRLIRFKTELRNFEIQLERDTLSLPAHLEDIETLLQLLRFVTVDILYRIVAAKTELREKRLWSHTGEEKTPASRIVPVRPFIRRLPQGRCVTPQALTRAKTEMGWELPQGRTFVSAFFRGHDRLEYPLISEPTVRYTPNDLLSMAEWS